MDLRDTDLKVIIVNPNVIVTAVFYTLKSHVLQSLMDVTKYKIPYNANLGNQNLQIPGAARALNTIVMINKSTAITMATIRIILCFAIMDMSLFLK